MPWLPAAAIVVKHCMCAAMRSASNCCKNHLGAVQVLLPCKACCRVSWSGRVLQQQSPTPAAATAKAAAAALFNSSRNLSLNEVCARNGIRQCAAFKRQSDRRNFEVARNMLFGTGYKKHLATLIQHTLLSMACRPSPTLTAYPGVV